MKMEKRDFILGFRDRFGEEFAVDVRNATLESAKAIARSKVKKIFNEDMNLTTVLYGKVTQPCLKDQRGGNA